MPPENHKCGTPTNRHIEIVNFYRALPEGCARQTITADRFGMSLANVLKARRAYERNSFLLITRRAAPSS